MGVKGGLEAAVHSICSYIEEYGHIEEWCCFKIDIKMLLMSVIERYSPSSSRVFRFSGLGKVVILMCWFHPWFSSMAGVQQGDPLGPMLFSLVNLELIDEIGFLKAYIFVWYLDDGTFIGTRKSISKLLQSLMSKGPSFGLSLNLKNARYFDLLEIKLFLKLIQM